MGTSILVNNNLVRPLSRRACSLRDARIESEFANINSSESDSGVERRDRRELHEAGPQVLLVDDNELVLDTICMALREEGYHVMSAASGDVGWQMFLNNREHVKLVILDDCMPGITGSEFADRLSKLDPSLAVILTSGYYCDDYRPPTFAGSRTVFLDKPFKLSELMQWVEKLFPSLEPRPTR